MAASKDKAASKKEAAPKKDPTRVIDLDQARAARAEARGDVEAPTLRLDGKDWELPVEVPLEFAAFFEGGSPIAALSVLFGEDGQEVIKKLSMDDLEALSDGVFEIYGLDRGK